MKDKIIFMHIPRTAGSSLRYVFKRNNIDFFKHNIKDPNYKSLEDYLQEKKSKGNKVVKPVNESEDEYIFSFVRNPWDRVVSSFFYLNRGGNNPEDEKDRMRYIGKYNEDFKLFVKNAFLNNDIFNQLHFRHQHKWICDINNNLLVNFIGRFENLDEDLSKLQELLSIRFDTIPHKNQSNHYNFKKYYDEETIEIIRSAYRTDIEMFRYDF